MKEVEENTKTVERASDDSSSNNALRDVYKELGWTPPASSSAGSGSRSTLEIDRPSQTNQASSESGLHHKSPWETGNKASGKGDLPDWLQSIQNKKFRDGTSPDATGSSNAQKSEQLPSRDQTAPKDQAPPKDQGSAKDQTRPKDQAPQGQPAKELDSFSPKSLPLPPFEIPGTRTEINRRDSPLPSIYKDHLPPFKIEDSRDKHGLGPRVESGPGKLYELRRLDNRAGDHSSPDAMVRIPSDFDPSKPVNLVIYNHGWRSTAQDAYKESDFENQMRKAPPNSVLIVPEWQRTAGASNGDQGRFSEPNRFRNMLQEIFNKTPELKGKTLNDVESIDIFSHSAGYNATNTEVYKNGLIDKVRNITMLDSNYDGSGMDSWIRHNINDLASGKKHFINIFNDTVNNSQGQAERVSQMLRNAGLKTQVYKDYNHPNAMLSEQEIAQNPIIFKFTKVTTGNWGPHGSLPLIYLGPIEAVRRKGQ